MTSSSSSSSSLTAKLYRFFLRECKVIMQPKYSELWKAVIEIHTDNIKQLSSSNCSVSGSSSSSRSINNTTRSSSNSSSSDQQQLLTKIIKDPKREIRTIFQHATTKEDTNVFFSMTSYEFFRYSRAANIIDRYHRAAAAATMERNDTISIMNRSQHNQQQQQRYERRRYIDGAIMISKLYYNETQLKAFLPQSIEQIVSSKMKLWTSLVQAKIEVERKQSSIAIEQVPKNSSAKKKNQSKQVRQWEQERSDLLTVLRGVHKEVMIHAGTISHDTYRGFNNNNNIINNNYSSGNNSSSSSSSGGRHIHVIDQFMHPCIDSFTSNVRSIMFVVIFCDIINSLNLPIEATYTSFFSREYLPLLRLKTTSRSNDSSSGIYPPIPPYKKGNKKSIEHQDRIDTAAAIDTTTADDDDDDINKDLYNSESGGISIASSHDEISAVFTTSDDDDNTSISAGSRVVDNDIIVIDKERNESKNDRDNENDERDDDHYDDKDSAVIDWSKGNNNNSSNSSSSNSGSPKQAVIETMSHSICNKSKGKGKVTSPLFPPPITPSTKSIDSRSSSSNSSNSNSNRGSNSRSSSSSSSSSNSNIDMDFVPQLVHPQHLTGRWVACDYNDDDYRFQEVMVSYGRNGSLEAYKLDRNGFIEANKISWKINFYGDNNYKTVGKKIRVGASYKAEVQIALPRNMEPEFLSYNFKLHALPMSTFLSKSESLQLHHHHQEQQYAGVPRHSPLSSSMMLSSSLSSTYYEIELETRHRNPNKRASHTCQKISFCRTVDMDRCLFSITNRGVVAVTPVQYLNHIIRYVLMSDNSVDTGGDDDDADYYGGNDYGGGDGGDDCGRDDYGDDA